MFVLDLKLVLFLILLIAAILAYFVITAVTRHRQQQKSPLALLNQDAAGLRHQFEAAPYGLLLLNDRAQISYQNPAAQKLLSPEALAELYQDVQKVSGNSHGRTQSHTRVLSLPDDRAVHWWICPLKSGTLVVLADLSQQRRLEKSAQLFLSSLSHELRTPLTAVLAHIEVLHTPDLPETVRQNSLSQIQQETGRLARLVQDLLTLSRLEASSQPELRPIDLILIAEAVISDVILAAEAKAVRLSLQAEANLPRALADPDRLKQVLLNLLDNALKYGRAGDNISVQLAAHPQGILVSIQDTGPGIPARDLPRVTERLYRGRTDVPGSGLGLAIAAEILQQHGSQLQLQSASEGQTGTTAQFILTAVPDK